MKGRIRRSVTVIGAVTLAALMAVPGAALAKGGPPAGAGGGGGKPGGETAVNNLSFPIEWAEGSALALTGTELEATVGGTVLAGTNSIEDLTPCLGAIQKDPLNVWQAQNDFVSSVVNTIDWGDNLEAKDWKVGSVVRVETGLYDENLAPTMLKFEMCYISGSGTTEVWGLRVVDNADGTYSPVTTESSTAMVYTADAWLTIQKVDPTKALTWDPITRMWTGEGALGNTAVSAAASAELNVQGKVVYGYVWRTKGLSAGEYRITFSLGANSGTSLVGATVAVAEANQAVVDNVNDLTYIDVGLTTTSGGGKKK